MTRTAKAPLSTARSAIACALLAVLATPALAGTGSAISVPEPTDLLLFAMGVAGVAIGRRMHAKAARRNADKTDGDPGDSDEG
jgi:hypothetical protein